MQTYIQRQADRLIPNARFKSLVKVKKGSTRDIMDVVMSCYDEANGQMEKFAPLLKGRNKYTTCRNVWEFAKSNIAYKIDPPGEQWIKEPARVWKDKDKGCDCKSYSVFIASLLTHLGINAKFRFVSFDSYNPEPTHVYIVVPGTEAIILDCVMPHFDSEAPYQHKTDYNMTRISQLSGVAMTDQQKWDEVKRIDAAMRHEAWSNGNNGMLPIARAKYYANAMDAVYKQPSIGFLPLLPLALSSIKSGAIKAALDSVGKISPAMLASLFSANGVPASFFTSFSFLSFLDNSTWHWKSKANLLNAKTPAERLSYFTDDLNKGQDPGLTMTFYAGMYGPDKLSTGIRQADDTTKIPYALAYTWNELVKTHLGKGGPDQSAIYLNNGDGYAGNRIMFDLTKCPDYAAAMTEINSAGGGIDITETTGPTKAGLSTPLVLGGLGLAAAYFLFVK